MILLVALIVLGPTKLPPAVRQVGKFVGEIRRMGQGFQQELREASKPLAEATETLRAADPRKVISPEPPDKKSASDPVTGIDEATAAPTAASKLTTDSTAGPLSWGTAKAKPSPAPAPSHEGSEASEAIAGTAESGTAESGTVESGTAESGTKPGAIVEGSASLGSASGLAAEPDDDSRADGAAG